MTSRDVTAGELVTMSGKSAPAEPSCGTDEGVWLCVSHVATFPNNVTAQGHQESGDHVMAWLCFTHGVESPTL